MKTYKVSELEEGKLYQCVLSGRKMLIVSEQKSLIGPGSKKEKTGYFYDVKKDEYILSSVYDNQMTDIYDNKKTDVHVNLPWIKEMLGKTIEDIYSIGDFTEIKFKEIKDILRIRTANELATTLKYICDNKGVDFDKLCNIINDAVAKGDMPIEEFRGQLLPVLKGEKK